MRNLRIMAFASSLAVVAAVSAQGSVEARDLATLGHDEITALQQRLTDTACYKGTVDGIPSPALDAAIKACPSQDPILRIETGMHTAAIQQIAVDGRCTTAVTASPDKTIRGWSMADGKLLYTQRLPIGEGYAGQMYAAAITLDGTLAAAAGYDESIYVFDAPTGQNLRLLGKAGGAVEALAFSPDGKRIAAAAGGSIRMFDVASGRELMADTHVSRYSYSVAFGPDGTLYATVGEDGLLRHYGLDGSLRNAVRTSGGKEPFSLAIDPAGHRIAVGFIDTKSIEFFDADTLRRVGVAETSDATGGFIAVAWSQDGATLFAGGDARRDENGVPRFFIRRFNSAGRRLGNDSFVSVNSIDDIRACRDGVTFATGDPSFGVLHADGTGTVLQRGHVADLRLKLGDAFTVSEDGTKIRLGLSIGAKDPVLVDLTGGQITPAVTPLPDLMPPDAEIAKLHIAGRFGYAPGDVLRSMAIRPDRSGIMLGTNFVLMSVGVEGTTNASASLRWSKQAPGETFGVNLARGGKLVVAAYADGTIRWYRWSDGQELLALFIDKDDRRWVAWTPAGYYMASPGGEDLIGWHVNRGWAQSADFFAVSRLRARFSRPDIVKLVLTTLDEAKAVEQANAASRRKTDIKPLIAELPPVIRITGPASSVQTAAAEVTIAYAWRSPSGPPVDRIAVRVNGRTVKTKGLPLHVPGRDAETTGSLAVTLTERDNEIGLIAWSGDLSSQEARTRVAWTGAPAASNQDRKLYAVVVGVSSYTDAALSLGFAAKDAGDFAKALGEQKGGYYGDVQTRLITDRVATRESILEGLEWLEANVTHKDDVGIFYLAGHGVTDDKQAYWFLPADATEDNFRIKGVSQDEMRRSLQILPGKILWFLDTCHAGGATKRPVDLNVLLNTVAAPENGGIVTFASSAGRELSEERPDWHNGAFTKAIVEGIAGGLAARPRDGSIMTLRLYSFLDDRVQELTDGRQHPILGWPTDETDFAIAQKSERPQK